MVRAFLQAANGGARTEHIMGWDIKDDGFGVVLSPELPSLMSEQLAPALQDFLGRNGFELSDFNGFLFHPGGRKLIETMQQVLGLTPKQLEHSWGVLRDYGNMSSATVLFVLYRAMMAGAVRICLLDSVRAFPLTLSWPNCDKCFTANRRSRNNYQ